MRAPEPFVPAAEATPAAWITDALHDFGTVASLLPDTFPAYVRILHPARDGDPDTGTPIRWAEIARRTGRRVHAHAQWPYVLGTFDCLNGYDGICEYSPSEGSIPVDVAEPLVTILREETAAPQRFWFGLWEGWGGLREIEHGAEFEIPGRTLWLFHGPLEAATISFGEMSRQSANLWWPEDHSWCVATDIDLESSYVGCSRTVADRLLTSNALEAFPARTSDDVSYISDKINPRPADAD